MKTWLRAITNWFKRRKQKREPIYGAVTSIDKASEYAAYFSKKLLEHQVNALQFYDPEFRAEIPKDPETLKRIFP